MELMPVGCGPQNQRGISNQSQGPPWERSLAFCSTPSKGLEIVGYMELIERLATEARSQAKWLATEGTFPITTDCFGLRFDIDF